MNPMKSIPGRFHLAAAQEARERGLPEREEISWRQLIGYEMRRHRDSFRDVVSCTLSKDELDVMFDNGFGGTEGKPFTLWTGRRVYFPVCYDGAEMVRSAPRDPCDEPTDHVGG